MATDNRSDPTKQRTRSALKGAAAQLIEEDVRPSIDQVGSSGYVRPPSEWRQARTLEEAVANPVADQRMPSE